MASAGVRAYSGGLGAVPPVGSRSKAPCQGSGGRSPPKPDNILVLFSIQFSRSGCRCGRHLTKQKCMYDVYYAVHTHSRRRPTTAPADHILHGWASANKV